MNWDQVKGDWHHFSRRIKEKCKSLTDEYLTSIAGRRGQLVVVLQKRHGYDEKRARVELDKFTIGPTS